MSFCSFTMVPQIFESKDLLTIGFLVLLEALLSADNALIMAIMVRHLPADQQKKALQYGMWGAFVLRGLAIFGAASLIKFWWIQTLGAIYLIYLPIKHFRHAKSDEQSAAKGGGFWQTVILVDLMDLVFAIDSVLVAVAIVRQPNKLWVIILGAILGIALLRFVANWCIKLLERYPKFDDMAYVLIGWAGVKLFFESHHTVHDAAEHAKGICGWPIHTPALPDTVYWIGTALIAGTGTFLALRSPVVAEHIEHEEEVELLESTTEDVPSYGETLEFSEPVAEPQRSEVEIESGESRPD